MKQLKKLLKKEFTHLAYFYGHLRYKLFITLGLSLIVGLLDGFGLAMFLPLLQVADGSGEVEADSMGNLRFLVDFLERSGIELNLSSILVVIVGFFSLKGLAKFIETNCLVMVRQYFIKKIRFDSVDKLNNYSYKAFVLADSGRIQNTLSGEVARVAQAYQSYMSAIQAIVMTFVYFGLALLANPEFALLVAIGGVLSNTVYRQIYRRTKAASKKVTHDGHIYQGLLIQQVAFFKYLKATGLIGKFSEKLKEYIARIEQSNRRMGFYGAILQGSREPLIVLVVVSVIMIQVTYFSQGIALIILSLMFFYRALTFLMSLQRDWNSFLHNSGALDNMSAFMLELEASQERNASSPIPSFDSSIDLQDVSFSYGDRLVVKGVNLRIAKNEVFALVGESGSGKTTLVNLITGLMPIETGRLLIDGKVSSQFDLESWKKRIGYITQEPVIFNDTVFNNVTFWADRTPENLSRFWNACKRAVIDEFVRNLPDIEHSKLGSAGISISGGQKQRLSIARELYKDIDVLIMDEATSALDSETEKIIQQNIELLRGHYTIIIIAHRLATIKSADRIALMNKGQITGVGTFDSLQENEAFYRMVALQEL